MNFFKSKLSDDTEPQNPEDHEKSATNTPPNHQQIDYPNSNSTSSWSFGDLVKTLQTRSESVIDTYRRDLKEFGSGLRKESDLFREVGSSAIDGVLKSTVEIISQGKDVLLEPSDLDDSNHSSLNSRGYSRFDSQLNLIQTDKRTYSEDPDDLDDYRKWKLGFALSDYKTEIDKLKDDKVVESIYEEVVSNEVDNEAFWCRYFYRVHKLKQQEDIRANFVRRSLTIDDEEELSWDVDDEDDEEHNEKVNPNPSNNNDLLGIEKKPSFDDESETGSCNVAIIDKNNSEESKLSHQDLSQKVESVSKSEIPDKNNSEESELSSLDLSQKVESAPKFEIFDKNNSEESKSSRPDLSRGVESVPKSNENLDCIENTGKDGDSDLEWDEIEDLGDDEKKAMQDDTPKNPNSFKMSNATEDDEDLNWDIEDDDEPVKTDNDQRPPKSHC